MTMSPTPARQVPSRPKISRRWVLLGAASALLHMLAITWVNGNVLLPSLRADDPVITAALLPAALQTPPVLPVSQAVAKPPVRPRPPAPQATPPVAEPAPAATENPPPQEAGLEAPGTSMAQAAALPTEQAPAPIPETPIADAPPPAEGVHYKVDPPPSVELKYDVKRVPVEGKPMYGHGTISWQSSGKNYVINGEAGVLFITALTFRSEGVIDDFGVAPALYSEKRFRRPETNTHFHRERNTINFSASETQYPRKGGEQDRASIIWQLSGIGRGDSEKFTPDAEIDVFVAGVRDGEVWRIRVIGKEDLELGSGKMNTWHVVRVPKPGSFDQKLDIWLAPQHEWYPVKLRYTETNGDYLDMSLYDMRIASAR